VDLDLDRVTPVVSVQCSAVKNIAGVGVDNVSAVQYNTGAVDVTCYALVGLVVSVSVSGV
jgi:hypothetical protein